jgi:hypothetical protein
MSEDPRCCGGGNCIIDAQGRCWCGQQWDGQKMCHAPLDLAPATAPSLTPAAAANTAKPLVPPAGR